MVGGGGGEEGVGEEDEGEDEDDAGDDAEDDAEVALGGDAPVRSKRIFIVGGHLTVSQ